MVVCVCVCVCFPFVCCYVVVGEGAVVCFLSLARIELCPLKTVSLAGFGALGFARCTPVTLEYSEVIVKWWCCREHDELQSGEASSSAPGQERVESSN